MHQIVECFARDAKDFRSLDHRQFERFKTLLADESAKVGWIFHLHGLCVLTDWAFAPLGN